MTRIPSGPSPSMIPLSQLKQTRLAPEAGGQNLRQIRDKTRASLVRLISVLGEGFSGVVTVAEPRYNFVKREILAMISLVLTQSPLTGTDGAPGARTYYALPMYFGGEDAHLLREVGELIHPEEYSPAEIRETIGYRFELYKLEVGVPSDLLGFNIDGGMAGGAAEQVQILAFECYDGGRVFPGSYDTLHRVLNVRFNLEQQPKFLIDLSPYPANLHDIDRYQGQR